MSEEVYATYESNGDSVFVGLSISENETEAQAGINTTREETIAEGISLDNEVYRVGQTTSYFKVDQFMSWSRGHYFIYVNASSPQALDSFMTAFAY